ncbi:hypothetical protein PQR15_02480 [Streptomyces lydicus]|nr:hypothetical protein [Streptomyces lydicus]
MHREQHAEDGTERGGEQQSRRGWNTTTTVAASAGPAMKLISSIVVSSDSARPVNSFPSGREAVSTLHRVRDNGPTCGIVTPASPADSACTPTGSPPTTDPTNATIATAFASEATRITGRCPRWSASRPIGAPPTACPSHSIPATTPARPIPASSVSISSVPIGHSAAGSRARNETTGSQAPATENTARTPAHTGTAPPDERLAPVDPRHAVPAIRTSSETAPPSASWMWRKAQA